MDKINGVEKVVETLGKWAPSDLVEIESLELVSKEGSTDSSLTMNALFQARADCWPDFDKEMFRIVIRFENVSGLSLKEFGGGPTQVMGFDIIYVGDRGLERINFNVLDYEDNRISFNCKSISIESVS